MNDYFGVSDIARLIQMAVAPVFLVTGIGSVLNVIGGRIGRIVDRSRKLDEQIVRGEVTLHGLQELQVLLTRLRYAGRANALCVGSAILISAVVAVMFLAGLLHFDPYKAIGVLFVMAMLLLIAGLLYFFLEIRLTVRNTWLQLPVKELLRSQGDSKDSAAE